MPRETGDAWVAVGLFLTVFDVLGFGLDVASDTAGYALVLAGSVVALRAGRPDGPGARWWRVLAASAAAATVVSLFAYGGAAGHLLELTDTAWTVVTGVMQAAAGATFAAAALALRVTSSGAGRPLLLLLATALVALAVAGVTPAGALLGTASGVLPQAIGMASGLLQGLTVVVAFLVAGSGPSRNR